MKLFCFFLVIFSSFSYSCSSKKVPDDESKWASIQYYYRSGTVYNYSYDIIINSDKKAYLKFIDGYTPNDSNVYNYEFTLTKDQMKTLNNELEKSDALEGDIKPLPPDKTPDGGSNNSLRITFVNPNPDLDQPPRVKDIPSFPENQQAEKLNKLYKYIKELVPKSNWDDALKKRNDNLEKRRK